MRRIKKFSTVIILLMLSATLFTGCANSVGNLNTISSNTYKEIPAVIEYAFSDGYESTSCRLYTNGNIIKYTWDGEEFTEKLNRETFTRLHNALEYIMSDKDGFQERVNKYNCINTTGGSDFYGMMMCYSYASGDKKEGDKYLKDIEYIRNYKEPDLPYVLYGSIHSSAQKSIPNAVYGYLHDDDETAKIVDYDAYAEMWDYYTLGAERPYADKSKEYAVFVALGFSQNVTTRINSLSVKHGKVNVSLYMSFRGCMADGGGILLVVPVDKGTTIGKFSIKKTLLDELDNIIW